MKHVLLASLLLTGSLAASSLACAAPGSDFIAATSSEFKRIWNSEDQELYVPLHTHHVRRAYDPELIAAFNETPWGIGFGKSYKDSEQGWHGLYAMAFKDSYSKIEPIAGYGRLYPLASKHGWSASVGYTVFVTARHDIGKYVPLPGALPLVAVEKGNFTVMGTFIPGGHNTGNILFVFGKYHFKN